MNTTLEFNPTDYSPKVLQMIMAKAEEKKVPPSEALALLLDELADRRVRRVA